MDTYLRFLLKISNNIHRHLVDVRQARFPLLLQFLKQDKDTVEMGQWHDWLLALATDTTHLVDSDQWTGELVTALVEQLSLYSSDSTDITIATLRHLVYMPLPTSTWCWPLDILLNNCSSQPSPTSRTPASPCPPGRWLSTASSSFPQHHPGPPLFSA